MVDDRGHGNFDLLLGNDRQYSNSPWTYYQYIYQLPIQNNQTTTNYERYKSSKAWDLTPRSGQDPLDATPRRVWRRWRAREDLPPEPAGNSALVQRHVGHVQHETLEELALGQRPAGSTPTASWRNYWQMTSIDMLTHLKPGLGAETE